MNTRERFEKVRRKRKNGFGLRTRLTVFVTVEMLLCVLLAYVLDQLLNRLPFSWKVPLELELVGNIAHGEVVTETCMIQGVNFCEEMKN